MDTNTIIIIFLILILFVMLFNASVVTIIKPQPQPVKPIGGCAGTRYGCCPNGVTARMNPIGTNC